MDKYKRLSRAYRYVRMYNRIYRLLDVPVMKQGLDCGTMCNRLCCTPGEDMGLYLMPHEINMKSIKDANFRWYRDGRKYFIQCDGLCTRDMRPLQCRLYPLKAVLYQGYIVMSKNNAYGCPVKIKDINRKFIKNVFKAYQILKNRKKIIYRHKR